MTIVNICRWNKLICCQKEYFSQEMETLLQNIDYHIQNAGRVLKNDSTSTVVVLKVDGRDIVVKRANTKGWVHNIRRFFCGSRAQKNWHNANKLLKIGVSTFYPIAFMEERWGPLKRRSYFICSYIQGTGAVDYFSRAHEQEALKVTVKRIANMLQVLAKHWISHRDINLSNIILVDNQPWLIDLDGMRQHRLSFFAIRGAKRERERFIQNCADVPIMLPEALALFSTVFNELDVCV